MPKVAKTETPSQLAERMFLETTGERWEGLAEHWFARAVDAEEMNRADVERKARKLYTRVRTDLLAVNPNAPHPLDARENEKRRKLRHAFREVDRFVARDSAGGIVAIVLAEFVAPLGPIVARADVSLSPLPTVKECLAKFEGQRHFTLMSGDEMRTRLVRIAYDMPREWVWAREPKLLACVSVLLRVRPTAGDHTRTPSGILRLEEKAMRLALKRAVP